MFKTYEELVKAASFKGRIRFENRKSALRVLRLFLEEKEITLPNSNAVIIPEEYARNFVSKEYMECLVSWGFKFRLKKGKKLPKLPDVEGREFYAYALHHGYDYGHHREPTVTGLMIDAEALEARLGNQIEPDSGLYKALKFLEDYKARYSGRGANPNPALSIEDKVRNLMDENLYSWG